MFTWLWRFPPLLRYDKANSTIRLLYNMKYITAHVWTAPAFPPVPTFPVHQWVKQGYTHIVTDRPILFLHVYMRLWWLTGRLSYSYHKPGIVGVKVIQFNWRPKKSVFLPVVDLIRRKVSSYTADITLCKSCQWYIMILYFIGVTLLL